MAGGGGTRMWPASRKQRPKQFLPILPGGACLLGATVERLGRVVSADHLMVVTAADQVVEVARTAPSVLAHNVVIEPQARNTAACIGLGAVEALRRDPEAILAVVPSDQYVSDGAAYAVALREAIALAARGLVVTIGIRPTTPETGFGYVELGAPVVGSAVARLAARFVEKPDLATAEGYLASGRHLWNSGMFFFSARRVLDAIALHLPALGKILDGILADPGAAATLYPTAPSVSFDYAVMERLGAGEVAVVPGDFGWNDVGSWSALPALAPADTAGNVVIGDALVLDAQRNAVFAGPGRLVAALGVHDLVIVATDDTVLVMPRERAQDVREVVRALTDAGRTSCL